MPHPAINNNSYADFKAIPLKDEDGNAIIVGVAKSTFGFDLKGRVFRTENRQPIHPAPIFYGDPANSSIRFDSDIALEKPNTDVVLVGHAQSSQGPTDALSVGIQVGPVRKVARVFGDRIWLRDGGSVILSRPAKFVRMPLRYELAFGGWDRSGPDPENHTFDPQNPVGLGFGKPLLVNGQMLKAPNILDARNPKIQYGMRSPPAGFGFISPNWASRARYAGTYDADWEASRSPLLPKDFSRRFYNAASPDLIANGHLRGDEQVALVNVCSAPKVQFQLPSVRAPEIGFWFRNGRKELVSGPLDTLVVDADSLTFSMTWRCHVAVSTGIHDVTGIDVNFRIPALNA